MAICLHATHIEEVCLCRVFRVVRTCSQQLREELVHGIEAGGGVDLVTIFRLIMPLLWQIIDEDLRSDISRE